MRQFRLSIAFLLAAGALLFSGCASTDKEQMSERPWNAPKSWEHGMPTGMMPRY